MKSAPQTPLSADLGPSLAAGESAQTLYADVALGVPQEEPFQYLIPKEWEGRAGIGRRVWVPLRNQRRCGYIVGLSSSAKVISPKPIEEIIDQERLCDDTFLQLTRWLSEYYFCSWGQAIEAALPAPFKKGKTTMRTRTARKSEGDERQFIHASREVPTLTEEQSGACQTLRSALAKREYRSFLLHGVTGSGKTEVYLTLIRELLAQGKGSIVLVPEISLTPQTTDRFESRFSKEVAVIHSRLSAGKRLEEWHRIRRGQARVVVGARSAIFSPVKSLGLVVIDEEHDDSYKQEETPRYDAWLVAQKRCELENAVLIRGTATPRLESFFAAKEDPRGMISLNKRIQERPLPLVRILDMRQEFRGRSARIFSVALESAVKEALAQKEQVMLFLNRRGFAPFVTCLSCGYVRGCPKCHVSLVFHFERHQLSCHTCNYTERPPKICPECHKGYLRYLGMGTEKVESEAHRLFPGVRIARMDTDTTRKVGSHDRILRAFRKRELDILLGTQMITKGHDFPDVSVIGVISADTALHLPDFRSAERTFDLLTQVAGRAGRERIAGRVYIQTYVPRHYAILAAKDHDYHEFYDREIKYREELGMPPFEHLVQVFIASRREKAVARKSLELKRDTEKDAQMQGIAILGPAPCLVSKRRGQFYWNLFYKGRNLLSVNYFLRDRLRSFDKRGVRITVDVDPR